MIDILYATHNHFTAIILSGFTLSVYYMLIYVNLVQCDS